VPDAFDDLQRRLGPALEANRQGSTTDHVLIILPSYSVSESLLSHYGDRIPSLEHRYLNALLIAGRIEPREIVYVSSRRPAPEVVDYYISLMPRHRRGPVRDRLRIIELDDGTPRSVAARPLDKPAALADIRAMYRGRPAFIEPWNVIEQEVALDAPVNGTSPDIRPLALKSAGRRLIAATHAAVNSLAAS